MKRWLLTFIGSQFLSADVCPGCNDMGVSAIVGGVADISYLGFTPGVFIAFPTPKLATYAATKTTDLVDWINKIFGVVNPNATKYMNFLVATVITLNSVINEIKQKYGPQIAEIAKEGLFSTIGYTTDKQKYMDKAEEIVEKVKKAIEIAKSELETIIPEELKKYGADREAVQHCLAMLDQMIYRSLSSIDYSEDEKEMADQIIEYVKEEALREPGCTSLPPQEQRALEGEE